MKENNEASVGEIMPQESQEELKNEQLEKLKEARDKIIHDKKLRFYFNDELAKQAESLQQKYGRDVERYAAYNELMGITTEKDADKFDFEDRDDSIVEWAKDLEVEYEKVSTIKEGEPIKAKYNHEWMIKYNSLKERIDRIRDSESLSKDERNEIAMVMYNYAVEVKEAYGQDENGNDNAGKYVLYHALGASTFSDDKEQLGLDVPKHIDKEGNKPDHSIEKFIEETLEKAEKKIEKNTVNSKRKDEIESNDLRIK